MKGSDMLEVLAGKERDIRESMKEVQASIREQKEREQYLRGRLYEVEYLRESWTGDEHE